MNLETHACHLHRLGLKDREETFFRLLAPDPPFQWLQKPLGKVARCFVFTRQASETAIVCDGPESKEAPSSQDPGALSLSFSTPQSLQAEISIMDQRESSFCFSVVVRVGVGDVRNRDSMLC